MSINQGLGNAQALCGSHLCPVGFYFAPCITVAKPGIARRHFQWKILWNLRTLVLIIIQIGQDYHTAKIFFTNQIRSGNSSRLFFSLYEGKKEQLILRQLDLFVPKTKPFISLRTFLIQSLFSQRCYTCNSIIICSCGPVSLGKERII